MTEPKKCEFCDKRGLPLLLVRDAVAQAGQGAPLANEAPIELAAAAAHYTKRLLRTGYVNVYDEARKRWEAYFVTPDGYYFKLLVPKPGVAPVVPAKPFNCPDQGHGEIASCITIADPKHATKVWIGFSDVLWTATVRTANEDAAYRRRHMVEIDVQAALGGGKAPHTRPIAQLPAVVAEYAMNPRVARTALGWSPFVLSLRQGKAQPLVDAFNAMRDGKGLIVTLPDPAGIVQELAALMKHSVDGFMNGPDYRRNLAANAAIDELEGAIRRQGEVSEIDAGEQLANQQVQSNPLGYLLFESQRKATEQTRHVTLPEATKNANVSWAKYAKKFNNGARTAWKKSFDDKLKAHDQKFIAPLAKNHVSWMRNPAMASYFECNYDRASIDSGLVYTAVVTGCVASTQDKLACSVLYDEWMAGDINDNKNFLLRGMIFNMKKVADSVKSATTVSIDVRQIPWDNVFSIYTSAVARVQEGATEIASRFIVEFAGSVSTMLRKVMDGTPGIRAAFINLGLIGGHPIVVCDVVGGRKKFREYIIKTLLQTSGQTASKNQMRKAIGDEMKRLDLHGTPIEGSAKKRWIVMADKQVLESMPSGLTPNERVKYMANSIRTVQHVEDLNLGRWREVISSKLGFGIIAGLLQAASLTKLIADEEKALVNESRDAKMRLYAGVTAVAATTADVIGTVLEKRALQGMRFGQGASRVLGSFLAKMGGRAAIAAGLFVAGLDVMKAVESRKEGQNGLAILYGASAVLGGAATIAMASLGLLGAAAIPVIGILILLLIGVAILIEYVKDNPVQDWLERCPWGILPAQRYPNMKTEQDQLLKALG